MPHCRAASAAWAPFHRRSKRFFRYYERFSVIPSAFSVIQSASSFHFLFRGALPSYSEPLPIVIHSGSLLSFRVLSLVILSISPCHSEYFPPPVILSAAKNLFLQHEESVLRSPQFIRGRSSSRPDDAPAPCGGHGRATESESGSRSCAAALPSAGSSDGGAPGG